MSDTVRQQLTSVVGWQTVTCDCGRPIRVRVMPKRKRPHNEEGYLPYRGQCAHCGNIYTGTLPVRSEP